MTDDKNKYTVKHSWMCYVHCSLSRGALYNDARACTALSQKNNTETLR